MALPHYFLPEQILSEETKACFELRLSESDAHHLKVARMKPGEHVAVIDASNNYFECELDHFEQNRVYARICQKLEAKNACPHITLIQGLAKGEKMELVIRHATELGVSCFIPLKCKRSVVKLDEKRAKDRVARWNNIAKSAAMQSGQTHIATVEMPQTVAQVCTLAHNFDAFFICWEEAPESEKLIQALSQFVSGVSKDPAELKLAVVVGPEGGIEAEEIHALMQCENAHLVSLGSSILRTETAGIVAPALILYSLGQLGGALLGTNTL